MKMGTGMNFALGADLGFVAEDAKPSHIVGKVSLIPDSVGLPLLTCLMGLWRANVLCTTGLLVATQKVFDNGRVNRVGSPGTLLSEFQVLTRGLDRPPAIVVTLTKSLLNRIGVSTR